MKRVLVTGGSGYVGRTLVRSLYGKAELCVVDLQQFGEERLTDEDKAAVRLERVDIRDRAAIGAIIASFAPDVIIHLAAVHFIPACEQDPAGAISINVDGTVNLLEQCPAGCRFVFASSGAVYAPSDALHDEVDSLIGPADIYGYTKLHGEHYVRYLAGVRKFPAVVVRLFNVVGPGETNPHLLPEIVAQMKSGAETVKLGNTWPKRDYIHVEDAAAGFAAAGLAGDLAPGETATVNLGTSRQYSVEEVIAMLRDVSGQPFTVETDPSRVRAVDRPYLGAAIARIHDRFGWSPARTMEDSVRDLWQAPDLSRVLLERYGLSADSQA